MKPTGINTLTANVREANEQRAERDAPPAPVCPYCRNAGEPHFHEDTCGHRNAPPARMSEEEFERIGRDLVALNPDATALYAEARRAREEAALRTKERDQQERFKWDANARAEKAEADLAAARSDCQNAEEGERAAREEIAALKALLRESKRSHYYCEDSWYSCPKAEGGCADDSQSDACNCGADKWNARIEEVLR